MKVKLLFVIVFLAAIACSAQASTISGSSTILVGGEAGFDLQMTFTSDVSTDLLTSADFNMGTGGGAMQGPSMNFICPVGGSAYIGTPPSLPSGFPGVQTFSIGYSGLGPGLISHYCEGAEVVAPGATVTAHINGDCPLTGTFTEITGGHIATFEGTCGITPECSVLTATHDCYDVSLEWTAWDDAFGYLLCLGDGNSRCSYYGSSLSAWGSLPPGTYKWHIIPVDDIGAHLCESNTATVTIPDVCGPISTPEFPSAFLPVTMIIGFLGAILLIQRTREH